LIRLAAFQASGGAFMRLRPVKKKPQNRKKSNIEFTLTHSIFSVNVCLRLPGLSSGFWIKKRKKTILLGFADSTKMAVTCDLSATHGAGGSGLM
jgi:hypothetical protein